MRERGKEKEGERERKRGRERETLLIICYIIKYEPRCATFSVVVLRLIL